MAEPTGGIPPIKDTAEAIEGLVKAVPIYPDIVQPAAKEIGEVLGRTVRAALVPLRAVVWGVEQIEAYVYEAVTRKLKGVPADRVQTPDPTIAGPALEALRFAGNEETLRELYANLLAMAMDRDTAKRVHPAFVEVIKQLVPDEARILSVIGRTGGRAPMPLISVSRRLKDPKGLVMVRRHFSLLGEQAGCQHPELTASYIDNLCRLKLTEIPTYESYTDKSLYAPLEAYPSIVALKAAIEAQGEVVVIKQEILQVTTFGNQFLDTCVIEKQRTG